MNVPLHGGHPHTESTAPVASPELILVFALGVVLAVLLLQVLIDKYLTS